MMKTTEPPNSKSHNQPPRLSLSRPLSKLKSRQKKSKVKKAKLKKRV